MTDLTLPGTIPGLLRRGSPVPSTRWPPGELALELRDATGRAHAAWWLVARHELNPVHGVCFRLVGHAGSPMLVLLTMEDRGVGPESVSWEIDRDACPSLADLDPADPRLLPDGSRWVDAEALRRVVLHVAGVSRA